MRAFGRRVHYDPRSRDFAVRALVEQKVPRGYSWGVPVRLNQGNVAACVGFAWIHELAARPKVHPLVTEATAMAVYHQAQLLDPWPETPPEEGTSTLAGAQAMKARGWLGEYRWCFSLSDLILTVGYLGPVVLGVWWREGMMDPEFTGLVNAGGSRVGGHAILCTGYSLSRRQFRLTNSWGPHWGVAGQCWISETDMEFLLHDDGEACVPVVRMLVPEFR